MWCRFSIQQSLEEAGRAHVDAKRAAKHRKQKEKERSESSRSERPPRQSNATSGSDATAASRRPTLDLGNLEGRPLGLGVEAAGPTRSASLPAVATLARSPVSGTSPSGSPRLFPMGRPSVQPSISLNTALSPRTTTEPVSPSKGSSAGSMTPSSSFSRLIPKPLQLTPNRTSSRSRSDSSTSLVPPSPTTLDPQQTPTLAHRPSGMLREMQKEGLANRGRAESSSSEQSSASGSTYSFRQGNQRVRPAETGS